MDDDDLPMGWQEVEPVGIPTDAGTPEEEWEETKYPRKPRDEIQRWVRGNRYVRICTTFDEEGNEVIEIRYGLITCGNDEEDDDWWKRNIDSKVRAEMSARNLMRFGGLPS